LVPKLSSKNDWKIRGQSVQPQFVDTYEIVEDVIEALVANLHCIEVRLAEEYGRPVWRPHAPPLDELVATILSQHTSDVNSGRAFAALRARFPTWTEVAGADEADIAEAIRPGGLANLKAPRIQRVLSAIEYETGELSLDWLRDWPLEQARAWLLELPGVGPKTAACVLLFSLGLPTMPVDTHLFRVGGRLGLIPKPANADDAHAWFDRLIGPERDSMYALHVNLIRHGRTVCKARLPDCGNCVLNDLCPSAFRVVSHNSR
jgi:endonuclease III